MTDALAPASQETSDASSSAQPTPSSPLFQVVAWSAIVLGSAASHVVWVAGFGYQDSPLWDYLARLFGLAVLLALTWLWPRLRPLRGFLAALLAFNLAIDAQLTIIKLSLIANLPPVLFVLTSALLSVGLTVGLMALTLIHSGLSRRDLLLSRGR